MDEVTIKLPDWEMNIYEVFGVNPKTNRKKTKQVVVVGEDEEKAKQKSGLIDIISVECLEPEPPSNAQIEYGRDLGIAYNDCYNKQDYTALISVATAEEVYVPIDKDAAEFAADHNIYLSQYDSMTKLYRRYYYDLSTPSAIAFFAFTVYQSLKGFTCYDYTKHPQIDLFEQFSKEYTDNPEFMRSFSRYEDLTEFIPNYGELRKTTNAYKICYEFFCANGVATPIPKKAVVHSPIPKEEKIELPPKKEKSKYTTFGAIIGTMIAVACLIAVLLVACHK